MRVLKKLYYICQLTGQVFRQEVHRFLCCYRATPHRTIKLAPAELMFPRRNFHTRLPVGVIPRQLDFKELFQRDPEKKMQMKAHADRKNVKQYLSSKASPPYEGEQREVQHRKGQMAAPLQGRQHISRKYLTRLRRGQADGSLSKIPVTSPAQSPKCRYPR